LGRQTLALTLNIGFNTAGVLGAGPNSFGWLIYTNGGDSLNGLTINQILDAANRALAGLGLPAGYDFSTLASLINNLNISFEACSISSWAAAHLSAPTLVVACVSQIPAADSTVISASDTCSSPVTITNLPDVISFQPCMVTRTWVARDACGNTNTLSYHIFVSDTTPPTMICQSNKTMQAGQTWTFDPPLATDNCGSVTVQVQSTVTNVLSGGSTAATCTWVAIDQCGNSTTCQQTVTSAAVTTTPPILTIQWVGPNRLMVSWPAPSTGFQLEGSDSLSSPNWTVISLIPVVVNNFNTVQFTPASAQKFYRLRK
jgi:hypothetical protein